ncbi:MAG: hypothetical protein GY765_00120 [bacterium]|nr:hypothetical protein [bacterium]
MKKRFNQKLALNKTTISNFEANEMDKVNGGYEFTNPLFSVCKTFECTIGRCHSVLCYTQNANTCDR